MHGQILYSTQGLCRNLKCCRWDRLSEVTIIRLSGHHDTITHRSTASYLTEILDNTLSSVAVRDLATLDIQRWHALPCHSQACLK